MPLERENTMKDLGVWFDDNLSFKQHMHKKINTAFMMLGIIHKNFKHLTIPTFMLLYIAVIKPELHNAVIYKYTNKC